MLFEFASLVYYYSVLIDKRHQLLAVVGDFTVHGGDSYFHVFHIHKCHRSLGNAKCPHNFRNGVSHLSDTDYHCLFGF